MHEQYMYFSDENDTPWISFQILIIFALFSLKILGAMQETTTRAQRLYTEDGPEYCGPFRSHFQEKNDFIVLFLFCSKVVMQTEAGLSWSCRVLKWSSF